MGFIEFKNVEKQYKNATKKSVTDFNLSIDEKEFIVFVGPSGCGKSTTLRMLAGFEEITGGTISIDGNIVNNTPPRERGISMVFQNYALYPHMTVLENVMFPLTVGKKKKPKEEAEKIAKEYMKITSIEELANKKPGEMSGGQQQRVAIARALVNEPEVLLLDEPLGALDLKLRKEMQLELKKIQQELGITFIFVTHDQEEALTMSDTIVVMNKGVIQQKGTPEDIYNEPANAFVADFIGESNILDGVMVEDFKVIFADREFECVDKGFEPNEDIDVVIRPEDFKIVKSEKGMLKGTVKSVIFKGVHYEMVVEENNRTWILHNTKFAEVDSEIGLDIYPEDIHIMKKVR